VGIFDAPVQNELFNAYPTITRDTFYIDVQSQLSNATVSITSLNGQLIHQMNYDILPVGRRKLNVAKQRGGMYIVQIASEDKLQSKRIIKL
jgi:hypothetical protein